ncbi:acyltransferase [Rhizobium sp. BR 314]|uniref:acyltransferase n=1 Tax=Rhizobium sp. BR 314 TaxID=3040013 RepID=UPI0039BF1BD8
MRFLNKLKRQALGWLARELDRERRRARGAEACVLGAGSSLTPEAEVNNFSGGPETITVGSNSFVRGRLVTYGHGGSISIGDWCYVGHRTEIWSMDSIKIGNRVLIAHDVNIHDGTAHSTNIVERHKHFRDIITSGHPKEHSQLPGIVSEEIVIEDDVWISFGVTILRGVRIGKGSVIAAGAIVTKDVPPGVVYRCEVSPVVSPLKFYDQ